VRRVGHPAATVHFGQNGPAEWATQASGQPAQRLVSSRPNGQIAHFGKARQEESEEPPPHDLGLAIFIDAVKTAGVPSSVPTGTYGPNRKTAERSNRASLGCLCAALLGASISPQPD
jgi:hypothetical protein